MFERRSVRRVVEPARAVWVNPLVLWPPAKLRWGEDTPLFVRSRGVRLDRPLRAWLTEWVLSGAGSWLARVTIRVEVDGQTLELDQLVPADAVRPVG